MRKGLLLALLLQLFCVQTEFHAEKIWLFSKIQYPGNLPVNKNGRQLRRYSSNLIGYLKISKEIESPNWQKALIYGSEYSIAAVPVNQDSVIVGTLKNTNSPIIIKAGTGSKLVRLVLARQGKIEKPEAWPFILDGTLNGKSVYVRSNQPMIELSPDLMP